MAEEAKWYVVHTYSGYENKVASNLEKTVENRQLQELIQEIRVPTEKVTEITEAGKRKEVETQNLPRLCHRENGDDGRILVRRAEHPRLSQALWGPPPSPSRLRRTRWPGWALRTKRWRSATRWATPSTSWTGPWRASSARWRRWTWRKTACASPFPCFGRENPRGAGAGPSRACGLMPRPGRSPERAAAPRKKQRQSSKAASGKPSRFDVRGNAPVGGTAEIFRTAAPSSTTNFGGANKWLRRFTGFIKLQIPAGKATPAPPVGPALGQHGVNIMRLPRNLTSVPRTTWALSSLSSSRSIRRPLFHLYHQDPARRCSHQEGLRIETASGEPNKKKVAKITREQVQKIAEQKMPDLNASSVESAMRMIAGTARSMGIEVVD